MVTNRISSKIIDLHQIYEVVVKKWYYFIIGLVFTLATAFIYLKITVPKYLISCKILVKTSTSANESLLQSIGIVNGEKVIEDEIGILRSFSLNKEVIEDLNLFQTYYKENDLREFEVWKDNFPFIIKVDTSNKQITNAKFKFEEVDNSRIKISCKANSLLLFDFKRHQLIPVEKELLLDTIVKYNEIIKSEYFAFTILKNINVQNDGNEKLYFKINDLNNAAENYSQKIAIEPISKNSSILNISTESSVIGKDIQVLNKLCELYRKKELEEKNHASNQTIRFIDDQLEGVEDSLRIAEIEMEKFRSNNAILDLSHEAKSIVEEFKMIDNERSGELLKVKYYDYLQKYLIEKNELSDVTAPSIMGITDPVLNQLVNTLVNLHHEKSTMALTVTASNPYSSIINQKIQAVKVELDEVIKNIKKASEIYISGLSSRIEGLEVKMSKLPENERKLITVQRKFKLNDNIFTFLLQKRAEAGILKASNTTDSKVIDFARIQGKDPIYPIPSIVYLVAVFFGMAIPLGIIVIKEMFNDKIKSRADIEKYTTAPILAVIRHKDKSVNNKTVLLEPKNPISESFRSCRVNLNFVNIKSSSKVIAFTSSVSGEGKSFCAMNLAYSLAMTGNRTILINADLRLPYLHKEFNLNNSKGLTNYLINDKKVDEIIFDTELDELKFIPSGPVPPNPFELLSSTNFFNLVEVLKEKYQYIIIDAPPLGLVPDYFLISNFTDATIYVVRYNYTKQEYLSNIQNIYQKDQIKNLLILFNDYQKELDSYGNYIPTNNSNGIGSQIYGKFKRKIEKTPIALSDN